MKCEKYLNLIDDLVEGELDTQSARHLNLHIFACSECASLYTMLKQEKQMYARYLFDAEPSDDLWTKFQAKLESETNNVSQFVQKPALVSFRRADRNGFWRLRAALAGAGLLILFGLGFAFLNFAPFGKIAENEYASVAKSSNAKLVKVQTAQSEFRETVKNLSDSRATRFRSGERNFVSPKEVENKLDTKLLHTKNIAAAKIQRAEFKAVQAKKNAISASRPKDLSNFAQLSEDEQTQILQIKTLEKETVKQIEKIEMLLRSFRNARAAEGSEEFDVAYEKQQARKLLAKNAQLRRGAEDYGALYTEEILSKAEPHLLDIANLENNPAPDKVLGIKERVKNQNIIASLQIY
ncbi:MAG: hypothetical protein WKF90_06510 [Pyrinomonadaceae bacterium]